VCLAQPAVHAERGLVRAQNRPLPGALVTAISGDKKLTCATDDNGAYSLELPEGEWTLSVEMFGFQTATQKIHPAPGAPPIEWKLDLVAAAAVRQAVAASPGPSAPEPVDSIALPPPEPVEGGANESFLLSGSLSQALPPGMAESPPEGFGRGPDGPLGLGGPGGFTPGEGPAAGAGGPVAGSGGGPRGGGSGGGFGSGVGGGFGGRGPGGPGGGGGRGGPSGPGGRGGPVDRLRRARAAQTNATIGNRNRRPTRNAIRGQLTYAARSSAWNARPFSITGLNYAKPDQASNRLSFTAGGGIPKLGSSANFSISYDLRRDRRAFNGVGTVPTLLERSGDFSQSVQRTPVTIYDPTNRLPFPGNRIPANRVDSAARGLAELIPLPNFNVPIQNYQFITGVPQNGQNLSARFSRSITRKDRFSVNQTWRTQDGVSAQLFGFLDDSDGSGWSTDLSWTHNTTPRLIQTIRARANRTTSTQVPFFANRRNVAAELGIIGTAQDPINWGPPNLSFTNFGALRDGTPSSRRDLQITLSAGWNWVHGRHTLGFGADLARNRLNVRTDSNARGSFTFSGLATSSFDAQGAPLPTSGYDYADFLFGRPQSSSIRFGSPSNYFRGWNYNGYVQDDWKVRRNLSLTLGLRYELVGPFLERYGRLANLDIAPGFTGVAVVTPGATGPYGGQFPDALVNADRNNLSPRTGLAWKVSDKHRLTVRSAYGIYYNSGVYQNFATRLASQPPFAQSGSVTSSPSRVLTIRNGFATTPSQSITNTFAVDRSYLVGYAQNWNASVSKDVKRSYVVEAVYLGTKGTRLDMQRAPNRAAPGSQLNAEERRRIGNAVGFTFDSSEANSIYHALQLRVTRRFSRGVSFTNSYMFGKSIDNASTLGGAGGSVAQDDNNLRAERGLSSFNAAHTLNSTFVLASPIRDRSRSLWANIARGWLLTGAVTARSGTPLTARVLGNRSDSSGTGVIGAGRADSTGQPVNSGSGFFNLAAFTLPPSGRLGNAGRNTITAPALFALNGSFGRGFRLGDARRRIEFRMEGTNLTNRVTISSLGTVVNASNYGLALGAAPMRVVQGQIRLRF